MEITAERLEELHKLQEVYIPQIESTVKRVRVDNLMLRHTIRVDKKRDRRTKQKTFVNLWRTTTTQMKEKKDQRLFKEVRLCKCGNKAKVTIYPASLLSKEVIYYGSTCKQCDALKRKARI